MMKRIWLALLILLLAAPSLAQLGASQAVMLVDRSPSGGGIPQAAFLIIDLPVDEGSGTALANNGTWGAGVVENHSWGTSPNIGTSLSPTGTTPCRTRVDKEASTPLPMSASMTVDIPSTSESGAFFVIGSGSDNDVDLNNTMVFGIGGTTMLEDGNHFEGITEGIIAETTSLLIGTGKKRVGFTVTNGAFVKYYIDGVFVGSRQWSGALNPTLGDSIKFGGYKEDLRNLPFPFNKVRVWSGVVLTDQEMLDEYNFSN